LRLISDIRTWHANIEQHASEGVNKILIGNKSDWTDKKAVTEEQGRELANELGIKFMETSAKVNEGVEEAFFTLARLVSVSPSSCSQFKLCAGTSKPASSTRKAATAAQRVAPRTKAFASANPPPPPPPPAAAHEVPAVLLAACIARLSLLCPFTKCCIRSSAMQCHAQSVPVELSLAYRPP
jgi:Ras-related protein Rab-8A